MTRALVAACVLASADAIAQPDPPVPPDEQPAPKPPATAETAPPEQAPAVREYTDEELEAMAAKEVITVYAERADKPFDRDTEVRLTGEQLAARGATDLATALQLLPDINVREGGRGGFNIDIRGARRGAVSIFIDGVLVSDPYYGTFDVASIPVTDIVQVRVATTPQSPIDGPGGPGGVIEVHTRDAIGAQMVIARLTGDTLPTFGVSGTGRVRLAKHLAARLGATAVMGQRDMQLPMNASIGEDRRAATGSLRLEYRKGDRRIALDGFVDNRRYISPPSPESMTVLILDVDGETTARATLRADDKIGKLQLQGQSWIHTLERKSRYYTDVAQTSLFAAENLNAMRIGGMALATAPFARDFRWATSATFNYEDAHVATSAGDVSEGNIAITELAVDAQYEHKRLRVDLGVGVAIPLAESVDPWPEAKLAAIARPHRDLELTGTVAYKGRVPSLRERFDISIGNPALGPELIRHAELRASWQGLRTAALAGPDGEPVARVHVVVAPYAKKSVGSSRICLFQEQCPDGMVDRLATLEDTFFYGVDTSARVKLVRTVEVGGSYGYVKGCELGSAMGCDVQVAMGGGADPLDRLPRHRADAWVEVVPHAKLSARVRGRYFGSSIDRAMRVEGYPLLEANVTAQVTKQYLGVLRVDDALDRRPETRDGFFAPGRVISLILQGTWE